MRKHSICENKCGKIGGDDKAGATAIVKRYVFGIVGGRILHFREIVKVQKKHTLR